MPKKSKNVLTTNQKGNIIENNQVNKSELL